MNNETIIRHKFNQTEFNPMKISGELRLTR